MNLKQIFIQKDKNSTIGTIRVLCAIFAGLISSYIFICLIGEYLNHSIFENIVIAIIILPFLWCSFALWIVLSTSKIQAIYKSIFLLALSSLFFLLLG